MKRALAAVLAAISLSACGAGTFRGNVAATVGQTTITVEQVSELVEEGLKNRANAARIGQDRAGYLRSVLERLVFNVLIDDVAERLDVTVTEAQVARHRSELDQGTRSQGGKPLAEAAAEQGIVEAELDDWVRADLLKGLVQDKLVPEPLTNEELRRFDTVQAEHILVADAARANALYGQLRAGADFATLARRFTLDQQTSANGGRWPRANRGQLGPELDKPLFEGPLNVVQPPLRTRFGYEIIRVTERHIVKASEVPVFVRREVQSQRREQRLAEQLTKVVAELGVEVNPRFGAWTGTGIGPAVDDVSSPSAIPTRLPDPNEPIPGGPPVDQPTDRPTAPPAG